MFTGPRPLPTVISKEPKVMAGMILRWRESSSNFRSMDVLPHTLQRLRHRRLARALLATIITAMALLAGPDVWGLDAPEWNHQGGSTATSTLHSLISGKQLRCAVLDVDRYGRLVAQCVLPSGRDIAAEMIRSGAATEYCRYSGGYYGNC